MNNWIDNDITLEGDNVRLLPLSEEYFGSLISLAKDGRIWGHYVFDGADTARLTKFLTTALDEKKKGNQFPFVVFHKGRSEIIGSTRFMEMVPQHRKLEIGATWLHPDHWATVINPECKLLLLSYSFEQIKAVRVMLKTDELNVRSRKAIEKIGAKFEGILRNEMLRDNGTKRNSAYYSIIDDDWVETKQNLEQTIKTKL